MNSENLSLKQEQFSHDSVTVDINQWYAKGKWTVNLGTELKEFQRPPGRENIRDWLLWNNSKMLHTHFIQCTIWRIAISVNPFASQTTTRYLVVCVPAIQPFPYCITPLTLPAIPQTASLFKLSQPFPYCITPLPLPGNPRPALWQWQLCL